MLHFHVLLNEINIYVHGRIARNFPMVLSKKLIYVFAVLKNFNYSVQDSLIS